MSPQFYNLKGLFSLSETKEVTYKINQEAEASEHVFSCFRLLGKVIGKAVLERVPFEAYMDKTLIRQLIGSPVTLDDIFTFDEQVN